MTRIVCWNINKNKKRKNKKRESDKNRKLPWTELLEMDADVALLQEVGEQPPDPSRPIEWGTQDPWEPWDERLYDRGAAIVKLSDRVKVEWFKRVFLSRVAKESEIAVSQIGTIAAARVTPKEGEGEPFIAFSLYAAWLNPHPTTKSTWSGYQDASAHRAISDISAFIGSIDPSTHRILAAGDFNTIRGATEKSTLALPARDSTIFERMDALGLEFMGPQYHPDGTGGRRAEPPSPDVPEDTKNVPTFYSIPHKQTPATAPNQLDYVFASRGFHKSVSVRAMNGVDEWGASDHCRLWIEVG